VKSVAGLLFLGFLVPDLELLVMEYMVFSKSKMSPRIYATAAALRGVREILQVSANSRKLADKRTDSSGL
jgi:hypothetical protein